MNKLPQQPDRPESEPSLEGKRIGKYEIRRLVGRGGMGAVYEAVNTTINKRVAMKCIDASLAGNEEANARFQREALAASAIESPHIVQIFDAGATDAGMPYIVMELLRGRDLGRCLVEMGRLEVADALHVASQVLRWLRRAHAEGIIHRDLKPDNVFLVEREDEPYAVKILDFGVSKINRSESVPLKTLTQQGSVVGTPYYMSPEQAQAFPDVDARTDLYSVGAILYECLAGRPPHIGTAYEQVIVNICMKDAEDVRAHNDAVPAPVAELIAKALQRERVDRFGSAREMLDALVECAPEEMRAAFRSAPSGMRRISLRAGGAPSSAGDADAERSASDGDAPQEGEPPKDAPLADTVRADSGMMSVATTPSDPPELPMGSPGRKWMLAAVVTAGLALGVGAVVVTSLGESGSGVDHGASPGSPSTARPEGSAGASEPPPAAATMAVPVGSTDPGQGGSARSESGAPDSTGTFTSRQPPPARPPTTKPRPSPRPPAPALPTVTGQTTPPSGLPLMED
jgi:serine/threonine-protein kinase